MNAPRNTQYRHLQAHKIAGSAGAIIEGIDLSHELSEDQLNAVLAYIETLKK